jgi:hypothetical protein
MYTEIGAGMQGRVLQRDQEAGQMSVHLGDTKIIGVLVKVVQLRRVHRQDGRTGGIVEAHHGGEITRPHVAEDQVRRQRHGV